MYGSSFCIRTREAALFEQHADRRASQPFAEGADDTAGDKNVFGHKQHLPGNDYPCDGARWALHNVYYSVTAQDAEMHPATSATTAH